MTDEELMKKIERGVNKTHSSHKRTKRKRKESWTELYERLRREELERLGYIKNN